MLSEANIEGWVKFRRPKLERECIPLENDKDQKGNVNSV